MDRLQGKSALITGGSKGIGYAVAEALAGAGMHVAVTSRHRPKLEVRPTKPSVA